MLDVDVETVEANAATAIVLRTFFCEEFRGAVGSRTPDL